MQLHPITLWHSSLYFALPGALIFVALWVLAPALVASGWSRFTAASVGLYLPLAACGVTSLWALRREGHSWSWAAMRSRLRLEALGLRGWLITLAFTVAGLVCEGLLSGVGEQLAALVAPPAWLPSPLNPLEPFELPPRAFLGQPLAGQWWVAGVYLACLVANIFGEELLWRGYLLPRQELTHGRYAWVLNGLQHVFLLHAFMPWNLVGLLPSAMLMAFAASYLRNTWASIVIHGVGNLMFLVLLIMGIMGGP